jgi:hypothetical protein
MSHSRFLSATRLATAVLALAAPGCGGDDSCGPGGAPDNGLVASGGGATLTFGGLTAGPNGDCPAADAPTGLKSLTIDGAGSSGLVTLCVSRPDLLARQPQTIELDIPGSAAQARLVDLIGTANNCTFSVDRSQAVTGTVSSTGLCGNGVDAAGFALVVDVALSLTRTCGQTIDAVPATLSGRVAVAPKP